MVVRRGRLTLGPDAHAVDEFTIIAAELWPNSAVFYAAIFSTAGFGTVHRASLLFRS